MSQETEVISCPACRHLLRVPRDWLGQPVQCPECKATFQAPTRTADGLTDPKLLSRPTPAPGKRLDPMLLLPAFGLMFLGFAGLVANGFLAYLFLSDTAWANEHVRSQITEFRKYGFGAGDPPGEQDRLDDERARSWVSYLQWVLPAMALAAGLTFLGGLSIALRWNYRLAQTGCVAAALNLTGLCCVPGAVAGLWGLLMLKSPEARAHFGR